MCFIAKFKHKRLRLIAIIFAMKRINFQFNTNISFLLFSLHANIFALKRKDFSIKTQKHLRLYGILIDQKGTEGEINDLLKNYVS